MTARHRVGKFDQTLQHIVDFGLGVVCNSNKYGADTSRTVLDSIAVKARSGTEGRNVRWLFVIQTDNWLSHGQPTDSAAKDSTNDEIE